MKAHKLRKCIICKEEKHKNKFSSIKETEGMICVECMSKCYKNKFINAVRELKKKEVRSYHRRYNQDPEFRARTIESIRKFREEYPEKTAAWNAIAWLPRIKGCQRHHWSYNSEHYTDVILMRKEDHYKIHKFIEYDKETKMYKDKASGFLLTTKSLHAAYISLILETY